MVDRNRIARVAVGVSSQEALAAVDSHNGDALSDSGGAINEAREGWHLKFWDPERR